MLDPIADMLTRIRNAQLARKARVSVRYSKMKKTIADILAREGYVLSVAREGDGKKDTLEIVLKYTALSPTVKKPAISEIDRVSTEGCRVYIKKHDIKKVKNGYGIAVVSTSQGVMTGAEAYRRGLGGEYICSVW